MLEWSVKGGVLTVQEREQRLDEAEESVKAHAEHPIKPQALIERLKRNGFDEYSIRAAIWILIGDGQLEITPARELLTRLEPAAR